jgi:hypothetical protein
MSRSTQAAASGRPESVQEERARADTRLPTLWSAGEGGGLVKCPLPDHDDAYASCQVFGAAEQGWWCFGCARGGRIYDLASLMSGGGVGARAKGRGVSVGQGEGGGGRR